MLFEISKYNYYGLGANAVRVRMLTKEYFRKITEWSLGLNFLASSLFGLARFTDFMSAWFPLLFFRIKSSNPDHRPEDDELISCIWNVKSLRTWDSHQFKLKCAYWANLNIRTFWTLNVALDQFSLQWPDLFFSCPYPVCLTESISWPAGRRARAHIFCAELDSSDKDRL